MITILICPWQGKTGFPWIDAIMMQLRQTGWIHNLARHSVACFLTRGDLWISWEEGMKVKWQSLYVDYDGIGLLELACVLPGTVKCQITFLVILSL